MKKGCSDHDGDALIVYTVIVDWWLKEVGVFFEPRFRALTAERLEGLPG